ncbi:hypothetical protein SAMN02745866_00259 [Alteromonadaceae bacterium Bs31]|nr:hypothetical protein SAMN02745866_00259 [Alteromonadaceae bacterium Bs31]
MIPQGFRAFFLVVLLGFSSFAGAAIDFYRGVVPVKSQSTQQRERAAKQAFAQVVVRLSGSSRSLELDAIRQAQARALKYVVQFQYVALDDPEFLAEGYTEQISLQFSPVSIRKLLMASDKYWPTNRPSTLVWLVEDSLDYGKQFVSNDIAPEVMKGFVHTAAERGLPLTYPLLDLQDQMRLSADQVWQLDDEAILVASQRYNADVVLVGRFSSTSKGEYLATWQFFHRGDSRVYDSRNNDAAELGAYALNPLADYLGNRYAIVPTEEQSPAVVMQLSGISSFANYRAALDYLEKMAAVSLLQLSAVRDDTLLLSLGTEASVERFVSVVALDGRMEQQESVGDLPAWQQTAQGTQENPLRFRWLR